jgi:hypothetical protein
MAIWTCACALDASTASSMTAAMKRFIGLGLPSRFVGLRLREYSAAT